MKKTLIYTITFICIISLFSCGDNKVDKTESGQKTEVKKKNQLEFEQIGYMKGDNKLRYFTFYVKSKETLKYNSIPKSALREIKVHGSKRMNTSGQVTASFYYIDKASTPDITLLSAQEANDLAHERKPIASVWIMPNGQINLIENPE